MRQGNGISLARFRYTFAAKSRVLAFILCLAMAAGMIQVVAEAPAAENLVSSQTVLQSELKPSVRASAASGMNLTFGEFVGSNSFFNENQATYEIFGNIREYHPWGFTEWTAGWYADANGRQDNSITSRNPRATFMNT